MGHTALMRRSQEIARNQPTYSPNSVVNSCGRQLNQMKHHVPTAFVHDVSWVPLRDEDRFSEAKRTES